MDVGSRVEYFRQRRRLTAANFDEIERSESGEFRYRAV
jgi:hypothetical protein